MRLSHTPTHFEIGDRVTTRSHQGDIYGHRKGVIMGFETKKNKNGARVPMVRVLWDGHQAQDVYSKSRLCHLEK